MGLNQIELAELMGVTVSMIRLWEKNGSRPDEHQYRTLESLLNLRAGSEMR